MTKPFADKVGAKGEARWPLRYSLECGATEARVRYYHAMAIVQRRRTLGRLVPKRHGTQERQTGQIAEGLCGCPRRCNVLAGHADRLVR